MKNKDDKPTVIIYREGLLKSIVSDTYTFAVLVASFAINQAFIGSKFLSGFILVAWFIWIASRTSAKKHTFTNKDEAIKFIKYN